MEIASNVEADLDTRVPTRPSELNAEWLAACLRAAGVLGAGERVASFDLERIGEGRGFAGQIVRLTLRYEPASATAPSTLIAKFATDHAGTRETLRSLDGYAREVRFYRELAPEIGLETPRCYFAHYDPVAHDYCLLLEDLAPAESVDFEQGYSYEQAQQLLEALAAMHARHWNRVEQLAWLQIDTAMFANMRERFKNALPALSQRYQTQYPSLVRVAQQVVPLLEGDEIVKLARRPPLTLMHGDLHIDNVFLPSARGGRLAIIDWQSVGVSRLGTYDVARLLCMGMRPEQRRRHERALLAHYHRGLCAHGVRGYSLRRLRMRYREEQIAIVMVTVLILDGVELSADGVARYTSRIEAMLAEGHASRMLRIVNVIMRIRRWFSRA